MATNHPPISREALAAELTRSRKQTAADLATLVTCYLEEAVENLRRALVRSADSALEPAQRLPRELEIEIVNLGLALRAEIRRRGR